MEELEKAVYGNYRQYKQELDNELRRTAEGFVRIGYLLKVAKDTDILKESGYADVYEFARLEYHLDKSQVSRFININHRFSENGCSDRLQERYKGMGYAKLAIMLQLPEEINEELSPEFSKSEIQAVKEEYDEEMKVSDLEILIEGEAEGLKEHGNLYKALWQLGHDNPAIYAGLYKALGEGITGMQKILAPQGEHIYSVRIQGIGRVMLSVKGTEEKVTLTNMRTMEKESFSWETVKETAVELMAAGESMEMSWQVNYGEAFLSEQTKVAPVQPKIKETKVQKATVKIAKNKRASVAEVIENSKKEPMAEVIEEAEKEPAAEEIWENMEMNVIKIDLFIQEAKGCAEKISMERLKEAYRIAVDLAADMERMVCNVQKYHA